LIRCWERHFAAEKGEHHISIVIKKIHRRHVLTQFSGALNVIEQGGQKHLAASELKFQAQ
jgi:hypothetical protein